MNNTYQKRIIFWSAMLNRSYEIDIHSEKGVAKDFERNFNLQDFCRFRMKLAEIDWLLTRKFHA